MSAIISEDPKIRTDPAFLRTEMKQGKSWLGHWKASEGKMLSFLPYLQEVFPLAWLYPPIWICPSICSS